MRYGYSEPIFVDRTYQTQGLQRQLRCLVIVRNSTGLHQTLVRTTFKLSWLDTGAVYFWGSNPFPGATFPTAF
jgi:hypothetical protein